MKNKKQPPPSKTLPKKLFGAVDLVQSKGFHRAIVVLVVLNLLPLLAESIQTQEKMYWDFKLLNLVSFSVFLFEYLCRATTATQIRLATLPLYKTRWDYLLSFYGIIDLLSVVPFILPNLMNISPANTYELISFARAILLFKLIRYSTSLGMVIRAIRAVRSELATVFSAAILVVILSSVLMFYAEHNAQPDKFRSVTDGMWWAVITFATVGYGDIYPITPLGKVIASVVSMLGIAMIALPSGIIGSSFRQIMGEQREERTRQQDETHHDKLLEKLNTIEHKLDLLQHNSHKPPLTPNTHP